jgi:hypothetical protein
MCTGTPPAWTHIPADERTALNTAYADWYTDYAPTLKPHTKAETAARDAAWARSRKVLSRFVQVWIRGFPDIVTAFHLANLGIPPVDGTPTHIGRPVTRPVFRVVVKDTRLLELRFQDQDSESKAIPYGMNGAVISWGIFDQPPAKPEDLPHTELATRTPHLLRFQEEDRGKRVYISMQWQNESGERGDFAEIQSAVVP